MLGSDRLQRIKDFVFRHGRLLERKLLEHFFEDGSTEAVLKVLLAYQNADGGFGNGIEPDLLCPASTAIGAETAMYVLDVLGVHEGSIVDRLVVWTVANLNDQGYIDHPPESLSRYPHQPWWENPDRDRVLTLAGWFNKWGIEDRELQERVRPYALTVTPPEKPSFYAYPLYVYLQYCGETPQDAAKLNTIRGQLPALLCQQRDHFPLLSRAWYESIADCEQEIVRREAGIWIDALQEDGALRIPYPDLPWWRPIFAVDGLIQLKKLSLI